MKTVPAFANCHSHAFHRALRGRITGADSFWSWRDQMYAIAAVLDPDLLFDLARATYAEMHLAGIRSVGEFHYVHHQPNGKPYDEPNAMGEALIAAAREADLRITLLDTCYLAAGLSTSSRGGVGSRGGVSSRGGVGSRGGVSSRGGVGSRGGGPEGVQRRFSDGDAESWARRVEELARAHEGEDDVVIGAAIHSVRAVPRDQLATVATALPAAPLHVHVSEQPAENTECLAATGLTPVALLAEAGVWTPRTTAVHATHLTADDIATLGAASSYVCFCPTTEAELADGIGPSVALRDAGARLTLGSDSNTVIDMFAEARAVEMHHRLGTGVRGSWNAEQLWTAATTTGHESLGFEVTDRIEIADSARTAGADELLWAASAADVVGDDSDVAEQLEAAIDACWSRV